MTNAIHMPLPAAGVQPSADASAASPAGRPAGSKFAQAIGGPQAAGQVVHAVAGPGPAPAAAPDNPALPVWQSLYQGEVQRAQSASDPAMKAFWQARADVIKMTLTAMGGSATPPAADGVPAASPSQAGPVDATPAVGAAPPIAPAPVSPPTTTSPPRTPYPAAPMTTDFGAEPTGPLPPNPSLRPFQAAISHAARVSGLTEDLIGGVMWAESRGNMATTHSSLGAAAGLMQIDPTTFRVIQGQYPHLAGRSIDDPATNLEAGALHLRDMARQWGSIPLALRAYNSGPFGVDPSNPHATPKGTGDPAYLMKVDGFRKAIRAGGALPA